MTASLRPLMELPPSAAMYQPRPSGHTFEPYGITPGATPTMRRIGSPFVIAAVKPSLTEPYAALRAVCIVIVKEVLHAARTSGASAVGPAWPWTRAVCDCPDSTSLARHDASCRRASTPPNAETRPRASRAPPLLTT